jgi:hypothetical protein
MCLPLPDTKAGPAACLPLSVEMPVGCQCPPGFVAVEQQEPEATDPQSVSN